MGATAELLADADVVVDGSVLPRGWVLVQDGVIMEVGSRDDRPPRAGVRTSLAGAALLPGFVDPHVHGGGGSSFGGDLTETGRAARFHLLAGTTSLLASLSTCTAPQLLDHVRRLGRADEQFDGGGRLVGLHLEGPFISPVRRGAHDPAIIRPPDTSELAELATAAPGRIRLLTAAPERPGFADLAAAAAAAGIVVSAGHTDADGPGLLGAIEAGVASLTHTFNGMRPVTHRSPGPLAAIVDSGVSCELICDGIHVHPAFVRMLRQLAGGQRVILITDAVSWAGLPDGDYQSADRTVEVRGGRVRLAGTSTLAGSTLTMAQAVRNYARFTGAGLAELAAVASTNAARLLGEDHRIGRIRPGHLADLVVLDGDLNCAGVMAAGRWARPYSPK